MGAKAIVSRSADRQIAFFECVREREQLAEARRSLHWRIIVEGAVRPAEHANAAIDVAIDGGDAQAEVAIVAGEVLDRDSGATSGIRVADDVGRLDATAIIGPASRDGLKRTRRGYRLIEPQIQDDDGRDPWPAEVEDIAEIAARRYAEAALPAPQS